MTPIPTLPPIVGGEEESWRFLFKQLVMDTTRYEILNLTGFTYRIEVWFQNELVMSFIEGTGITRITNAPTSDSDAHYRWTISETESDRLSIGVSLVKLFRVSSANVTKIDLVNLKRVA